MTKQKILFSGGGTVGHLAPGFALAQALDDRGVETVFATPGEAREAAWFEGREPPLTIPAIRLPRRPGAALAFPFRLRRCVKQARQVIEASGAGCVFALGGWPCAPAAIAARSSGVPMVLYAADEVPGKVVRWLRRRAGRIYVAYEEAARVLGDAAHVCGPLLRGSVLRGTRDARRFGLDPSRATLLVTGGSLGAQGLNDRWLAGLEAAMAHEPDWRERVQVIHATGGQEGVAKRYEQMGLAHHVVPFLTAMGDAYATADFFVGRAGAGTCAEVEALGIPALLVPYPHHADRQQYHNAERLQRLTTHVRVVDEADLDPDVVRGLVLAHGVGRGDAPARKAASVDAAAETASDLIRFLGWERSSGS